MTTDITNRLIPDGSSLSPEAIVEYGRLKGVDFFYQLLRERRNALLKQTDWTVSLDSPLKEEQKQKWIEYRQALRNLPQQNIQNIDDIIWPTSPID